MRARLVLPDGSVVFAGMHAVVRWQERCRPALSVGGAAAALVQVVAAAGVIVAERPAWMDQERESTQGYLMVGGDVVFPLSGRNVTTCIVKGERSAETLADRSRVRRERSAGRQRRRARGSQAREGNEPSGRRGAAYRKRNPRRETQD